MKRFTNCIHPKPLSQKNKLCQFALVLVVFFSACPSPESVSESTAVTNIPGHASGKKQITVCADEWFPYNGRPGSDNPGFLIEIIKEIFEKRGYTVTYLLAPWSRAIEETRNGKYDAIVGAYKGDAPDFIFADTEQGMSIEVFVALKTETWNYTGPSSLKAVTIGAIKNYSYGKVLDDYIEANESDPKKIQLVYGNNPLALNMRKLEAGRIRTFAVSRYVLKSYIKKNKIDSRFREAGVLSSNRVYVAFSPFNPAVSKEYARTLTLGMTEIRNSGRLKKILSAYGLEDWR